jgi:hypothetical protein
MFSVFYAFAFHFSLLPFLLHFAAAPTTEFVRSLLRHPSSPLHVVTFKAQYTATINGVYIEGVYKLFCFLAILLELNSSILVPS